ncbi:MAG: Gfo/Idh/MocA family oxidoreductase, partial [Armatimonadetes bacterium]|nr:Gfo/Idh/MocA family oxidoreductase [Armatimonadota bacterium]
MPSSDHPVTRRTLLRWGAVAGAAALARPRRAVAASDKLTVAHIGCGGMGGAHLSWFAGMSDTRIAAVCDVDQTRLASAVERIQQWRPNDGVEGYADFRQILDRPDIDVITTATPDHWHALIAMLSFQAGKDVYGEKPLSYCYREGRQMVDLARRYGRVFQLGTQIHADDNYHRVVELVRSGALGRIHTVHLWKDGGTPGLGYPADREPPATLDWDMWLGPAPWRPYNPAIAPYGFRYFWDYYTGIYGDFWCHIADIVWWALQPGPVRTVEAVGDTPTDGIGETARNLSVTYELADGLTIHWLSGIPDLPGAAGRGIGARFEGEHGALVCDYGSRQIFLNGKTLDDLPDVPRSLERSPGHQRNFLDCVKSREQPESNVEYVFAMTTPLYLGTIAFRLGRKLTWDAAARKLTVAGTMFFDGNIDFSSAGTIEYDGSAAIYLSGWFHMR